ncbi:carbohydrate ABC transporter substrate-binding protein, CUT1 family [Thermomonospora echinospora]|uniref:Carbohydrate ABC transporter substrate-binding protein, CUT1 family n=1 Tax=Thermomonospora echinospora TaxID=1992 RepID=A0A1H5XFM3_9ACTN|nr:ABC transporter substrate-binding protein [Thermomonospora echinospora]SEG10551.1 carbohydrate ABC transporter substrate-binding protein, CUT1 family [Thermomonospora echinospora]
MRRTPLVSVLAGLALALTACGGDGDGDTTTAGSGGGELTGRGPITLVSGKDRSGNMQKMVDGWNAAHPNETVRIIELPDEPNDQRQQMIQNATTRSDAYTVLNLDVVWTAEFAANRWLAELPKNQLDTAKLLPATVTTGEYRGRLYAMPLTSDSGLLFYRTDLLKKAGVSEPPKTWAEMWDACDKVKKLPEGKGVDCYLTEVGKTEGLTVTAAEAINSTGGNIVDASGKPAVNTPQAKEGVDFLVNAIKDGRMPKAALTLDGEGGRRHFQAGKLLFHRQWPYQYGLANTDDGSSKVVGKFAVAPIPGPNGPGAANLGGHNYAISAFAKNKATALDFIKYMADEKQQKANSLATSQAPTVAALYDDPEMIKKYPYLPTLKAAIQNAKSRPVVVRYGDVTAAIQGSVYDALGGKTPTGQAMTDLQNKLTELTTP